MVFKGLNISKNVFEKLDTDEMLLHIAYVAMAASDVRFFYSFYFSLKWKRKRY